MANKWHREVDEEAEDREIAELERQLNATVEDNLPTVTPEEVTWKKRYGDLRSYDQKRINELEKQLRDAQNRVSGLENQVTNKTEMPKTVEELKVWAEQYPDVYAFVRSTSIQETQKAREEVANLRKQLEEDKLEEARVAALRKLASLHPDFFPEIKDSPEFETWLNTKSKRTRDALYENDTDADAAAEVIAMYKYETNYGSPTKQNTQQNQERDAASDTRIRERLDTPSLNNEYLFSESQINKMGDKEYAAKEAEIDAAMKSGKVLMDMTGAAR